MTNDPRCAHCAAPLVAAKSRNQHRCAACAAQGRPILDHPEPDAQKCTACTRWLAPGRALNGHTLCTYCIDDKDKS